MKRKKAIALGYVPTQDKAPQILAKGEGLVAEKILAIAEENNIPTYKNPVLVERLVKVDLGTDIPEDLYQIVAEILIFIDQLTTY